MRPSVARHPLIPKQEGSNGSSGCVRANPFSLSHQRGELPWLPCFLSNPWGPGLFLPIGCDLIGSNGFIAAGSLAPRMPSTSHFLDTHAQRQRLSAFQTIQIVRRRQRLPNAPLQDLWAHDVFDLAKMRRRCPRKFFKSVQKTIRKAASFDVTVRHVVAAGLKEWATGRGRAFY